jgi:hypothetical protein
MKVLYVYNFLYPEYQSDSIYHGLIDLGIDVYETHYPSYMLKSFGELRFTYGKGFTLFGKLNHEPKVETPEIIIDKIKSRFYDIVIYGCIYTYPYIENRQCLDYLEYVKEYYPKNKIHFVDGADDTHNFSHSYGLDELGIVWKTSLSQISTGNPISFGVPESQLIAHNPTKEKLFSTIIPGNSKTYTYEDEESYYNDYAVSHYGLTWKKGQWECMRHYEILANKCVPYFPDIEDCPPFMLVDLPKEIIKETNKYARTYKIHPEYDHINDYLFEYTKNNLTTKKVAEKLLS